MDFQCEKCHTKPLYQSNWEDKELCPHVTDTRWSAAEQYEAAIVSAAKEGGNDGSCLCLPLFAGICDHS